MTFELRYFGQTKTHNFKHYGIATCHIWSQSKTTNENDNFITFIANDFEVDCYAQFVQCISKVHL